ncbi:unnamed protein product [Adineta ricciae]|uniref:Uncharacterized protein n=1 Tax=Adineta ricciae TaxID=249248 RepID=A0A814A4G8_ADIRI|nr:unnamed protein product [Adineta ricciae]CAF0968051.1 unnamed protein product [Adineta ricciae]
MMNVLYHEVFCVFLIFLSQIIDCRITNPAIGILAESNLYLAQIKEFNYTNDNLQLVYQHTDPIYSLQSLAANNFIHRLYICSPSTIYTLDTHLGSHVVPLIPIDETPCRSSLTYLSGETALFWAVRRGVIQLNFDEMSRKGVWNSTTPILDMIFNDTLSDDNIDVYLSISIASQQSVILYCRADRRFRLVSFQSCLFIASGYSEIISLAMTDNRLFAADRVEQQIYMLTLSPNGIVLSKDVLPLNTSTVADIHSMFIYENNLIWLTTSGHVRLVSLETYEVRTLFWLDEQLRTIRLVSFAQWPNRTTTSTTTTTTVTTTSKRSSTKHSTSTTTTRKPTTSTSSSEQADSTTTSTNVNSSPWKATTFVTSIILGIALFLCAAMITCVLLNYRLGRVVPNSFTNIFHILRNRTTVTSTTTPATTATSAFFDESLT